MTDLKNKIKRFAKGDFHIPQPEIIFPETHITMRVGEGEKYEGSFSLQNEGEGTIRGLVYPSSYRVQCVEQGFDGNPVNIYYTYDGRGLVPGHVEHGKFTIVCNGGEYDIAFTAIIEKPFVMTRYGKVQSLEDFKKLTYRDAAEAVKLFRSRDFFEILKYEDTRIKALYNNMRKWELDQHALEEFLVGCKQKEKIFLTLEEESRAFISLVEDRKETFTVKKNTWGYLEIDVRTEGDFLSVEHRHLTTDEFIGNAYRLEYGISMDKLHRGSNFGRIILETPYETLSYEVVVEKDICRDEEHRANEKEFNGILKDYLKYEGPTDPTVTGSFGNVFTYKGFKLNVFMTYSFGNVVRLDPVFNYKYSDLTAMPREFKNRWTVSGDEAKTNIPVIISDPQYQANTSLYLAYNAYNYSTERIAKGDFIRMKEISLMYEFPKSWIAPAKISNLSLKLQATNLFLIYADKKLNGQDPEFVNTGGVASPVPRQFTLTLRLGL